MNSKNPNTESKHTPEPWAMDWHFIVAPDPKGIYPDIYIGELIQEDSEEPSRIASPEEQIANGRRIVAAVNACKGIPVEALEEGIVEEMRELLERSVMELEDWLVGLTEGDASSEEALTLLQRLLDRLSGERTEEETNALSGPIPFDSYEIAPVRKIDDHDAYEICAPSEAQCWTLYGHIPGEGVDAIADRQTKAQCEVLLYRLTGHWNYFLNASSEKSASANPG